MSDLVKEAVYPHPRERVWRALTERELLSDWMMDNDFEPRVGHRFQFRTESRPGFSGVIDAEVLEIEPERRLSLRWQGGPIDTVVTWTLEDSDAGTRLLYEQRGFQGIRARAVKQVLSAGFRGMYRKSLPKTLDRMAASEQ